MGRQQRVSDKAYNYKFPQNWFSKIKQKKTKHIKSINSLHNFSNIYYVRYNSDLLLGLCVEKKMAKALIQEIQVFLKSDLHVGSGSSSFKCGSSELFYFLGFKIGGYSWKFNKKPRLLIRLNKIRANLRRKKIAESEKYFKLIEHVSFKMYRRILNSVSSAGQTVFERLQHKNLGNRSVTIKILNALKLSLCRIESEVTMVPDTLNLFKYCNLYARPTFVERRQDSSISALIKKWIQKAMDLIKEEDKVELEDTIGCYLSPRFIKAREDYLAELNKILSKNVDQYKTKVKKMCVGNRKIVVSKKSSYGIKMLLPLEYLKKKLRDVGILDNTSMRPISKQIFSRLKDYEIISWYSMTAKKLWDYYSCVDSAGTAV